MSTGVGSVPKLKKVTRAASSRLSSICGLSIKRAISKSRAGKDDIVFRDCEVIANVNTYSALLDAVTIHISSSFDWVVFRSNHLLIDFCRGASVKGFYKTISIYCVYIITFAAERISTIFYIIEDISGTISPTFWIEAYFKIPTVTRITKPTKPATFTRE